jgi:hypothetical protein
LGAAGGGEEEMTKPTGQAGALNSDIEFQDGFADRFAEPLKCEPSLLPYAERRFIDRYDSGRMNIGIIRFFGDETKSGLTIRANLPVNGDYVPFSQSEERCDFWFDSQQSAVLPFDIQVMQSPEVVIASVVRFERFEQCSFPYGQLFYEFTPLVFAGQKDFSVLGDRKINFVHPFYAVASSDRVGENIQGASKYVDIGSELNGKVPREGSALRRYNHVMGRIVFQLHDFGINVSVDPSLHSLVEGWKMGVGPIDRR